MNKTTSQHARKISYGLPAALALTMSMGIAGCSDEEDNRAGGGAAGGSAELTSTDAVATQVGTLAQVLSAIEILGAGDGLNNDLARLRGVEVACPDGGSQEDFPSASRSVASPFTSNNFDVSGVQFTNCRYAQSTDSAGNSTDVDVVINGLNEAGSTDDETNGFVSFIEIGAGGSPFNIRYDIDLDGSANGQSFSSSTDLDLNISLRLDGKNNSTSGAELRYVSDFDGDYETTSSSGGQSGSATGEFNSFIGSDDAPFTIMRNGSGLVSLAGDYGFGISPAPQGAECTNATVSVSTNAALMPRNSAGISPYTAGELAFSSGDTSATVTFNDDDTITIVSDGGTSTINYSEAITAAAPCSGFAFAGLGIAQGFGAIGR